MLNPVVAFLFNMPAIDALQEHPLGFFVCQGKLEDLHLHIPQAVADLYACAKRLKYERPSPLLIPFRKTTLRGALTNGNQWYFILLKLNDDGVGATYQYTQQFSIIPYSPHDTPSGADLIAGILSYWASSL